MLVMKVLVGLWVNLYMPIKDHIGEKMILVFLRPFGGYTTCVF